MGTQWGTMGVACALAAVAACGSEGDTDSTTATIDSTATVDSGDGDGDPGDPPCHCHAGDSCPDIDGVCKAPPLLFVSVHQTPGQARPDLTACMLAADGLGPVIAEDGDCNLRGTTTTLDSEIGIGVLTIAGATIGTTSHDPQTGPCASGSPSFTAPLPPAEQVTLDMAAGNSVSAATLTAVAPAAEPAVAMSSTLTRGEPFEITWTPGGYGLVLVAFGSATGTMRCRDYTDSGSIIVSGALTAMVSEVPSVQVLVGVADRALAYTPEGVSIELSVGYRPPAQTVTVVTPP